MTWHFEGDQIRHRHQELRRRLAAVQSLVAPRGGGVPDAVSARIALRFFQRELGPHMAEEERALYPEVDRLVGGPVRFTSVLRREHDIIRRWIVHLETASRRREDLRLFAQRALNLLGMLYAHMEAEDSVVLPLVDLGLHERAPADHPSPNTLRTSEARASD